MTVEKNERTAPGEGLLDRLDCVYLLALLVPFAAYTLLLKASRIVALPGDTGLFGSLSLMRSDLLFDLGYTLFWVGLFAVAKSGVPRMVVVLLFHATTIVVALIETGAVRFDEITGTSLDAATIASFLSSPRAVGPVVASAVTPGMVLVLSVALLYAVFGPWLLRRLAARRWDRDTAEPGASGASWLGIAGVALVSFSLILFSVVPGGGDSGAASGTSGRDGFLNVALSAVEGSPLPYVDARKVRASMPTKTTLQPTDKTKKLNVVLVLLESTRAASVTPYNKDIQTTPYLDDLAKQSVFAERAYAAMPHTTNAQTATICGVDPPTRENTESLGDDIPSRCLPELLSEQGYGTAYFQSATQDFERRPDVVNQMGYRDFYPLETMNPEGFQRANYFGYEDDILLDPSKTWLQRNGDQPFFVTYNTITPHHQYLAPDTYGTKDFAQNDVLNRYQNSVRYEDFFVKNLIQQYKDMGLYDDTIFVIQGDHGEGFGEHGRYQHDNVIWEEGLRIPMMILDPSRPAGRVQAPVNELDVLPTVADALGYRVEGGEYSGSSMLDPLPEDRTLKASCWYENECLASVKGDQKYIYHFGDRPEEFYDLSKDPQEKNNLAQQIPPEKLEAQREELLQWRARSDAAYGPP